MAWPLHRSTYSKPDQKRVPLQGFALFSSPAAARFAVDLISGAPFEEGTALRAEMARKNMYLKVGRARQV
jgi:hypothetical protein